MRASPGRRPPILSLIEKHTQRRVDASDHRLVERVLVIAGGNKLHDDGRVLALGGVVYELRERVPVVSCLRRNYDTERAVALSACRLKCVEQLPIRRNAELVVDPQCRGQTMGGFLFARQTA